MSLFDKRAAFRPFEYPALCSYKDAINHSYWLVSEWDFSADAHDYRVRLDAAQRGAVRNSIMAISQVEVSVKRFWARIGDRMPKAEVEQVGVTFAECEVRHADAYSHLLHVLGMDEDFEGALREPAVRSRVDHLSACLAGQSSSDRREFVMTLALFALFVENVSLFSQFLVIQSFNRHLRVLKDIDNVVQATQKEEQVHALFGAELIAITRSEHPEWFGGDFAARVNAACRAGYLAEAGVIDWIFKDGDLPFLPRDSVKEFVKKRVNDSLKMIGMRPVFQTDPALLAGVRWFDDDLKAETNTDFFHKKPVTYSKNTRSIRAGDLF